MARLPKIHRGTVSLSFNPKVDTCNIPPPSDDELPEMPSFSRKATTNPPFRRRRVGVSARAGKTTTTPNNSPKSISPALTGGGTTQPDWFEDLDDGQISMFKEVFELLDKDDGGTVSSEELYMALKDLDSSISLEEIDAVMGELDIAENGEIDFDEFLYAMCMTDRDIDSLSGSLDGIGSAQYSKRQCLFFSAITRFAINNSLSETERHYNQKDCVISFYIAGARLGGLNDRPLEQKLKRSQKTLKNKDSPYAIKLPLSNMTNRRTNSPKRNSKRANTSDITSSVHTEKTEQTATTEDVSLSVDCAQDEDEDVMSIKEERSKWGLPNKNVRKDNRRANITADNLREISSLLRELADRGSILARLPDVHLVQAVRTKLDVGDKQMLCSSLRKRRQIEKAEHNKSFSTSGKTTKSRGASGSSKLSKPQSWQIPKLNRQHFEIQTIDMDGLHGKELTMDDVTEIRQKVSKALGLYYGKVQKCQVETAWNRWENMNIDTVKSVKLREKFRKVYAAYSPHKEEDVLVIGPWRPGPRYTTATAGKPAITYAPTPRSHSTGPAVRSTGYSSMSRMSFYSGRPSTVMR